MTKTAWQSAKLPRFVPLKGDQRFDVVVIGGGITGLSAAYFLKQAKKKVCLLERDRITSGDTGCTTAHLTYVSDLRLSKLIKNFGEQAARLFWLAGETAIHAIESISKSHQIECEFRHVPGFLHAALHGKKDESAALQDEAYQAQNLGFDARFVPAAPLVDKPAIRFANQAKFHPLKYLAGLARLVDGGGSRIYEQTEVTGVEDDPLTVECGKRRVECDYVVIATHVPLMGKAGLASATLLQTKIFPYSTYAIGAKAPRNTLPEVSLWDTSNPYYYLRVDRGPKADYIIFGGADHKTGQIDNEQDSFEDVARTLKELVPPAVIDRRWSGQVIETNDGLPFIGETAERQFAATGFAGNGMTLGTVAGMMARDAVVGHHNPWQELFAPGRKKVRGGVWSYLKENVDYPLYYLKDRLTPPDLSSVREIPRNGGAILKEDGQRVACSRDAEGKLTRVSAYCTHMGCIVRWNQAEKTWDCPCHGSRFSPDGNVLAGPAETPLDPVKHRPAATKKKKAIAQSEKPRRRRSAAPKKGR